MSSQNQEQAKKVWVAPIVYEISLEKTEGGDSPSCSEGSFYSAFDRACADRYDEGRIS